MEKSGITLIRFDGKNYTSQAFQFQIYLEGKELWGYIEGSEPKPEEDDKKILAWKTKDAKIKTWLLGSVESHFILNLKPAKLPVKCGTILNRFIDKVMPLANFKPKKGLLKKNLILIDFVCKGC